MGRAGSKPQAATQEHSMQPRIGIFGGGQLGFYLCQAAKKLGLKSIVLTPARDDPAGAAADQIIVGNLHDLDAAAELIAAADIATFEVEAIGDPVLELLQAAERQGQIQVRPDPAILLLIKDKARQKAWLSRHQFPTLPFQILDGDTPPTDLPAQAFDYPWVQKTRQGGYDGRGVQVIKSAQQAGRLWPAPSLIEPYLARRREIAVVGARSIGGETRCYAPVAMTFNGEHNILDRVESPAELPAAIAQQAVELTEQILDRLEGVGVFAVEMFLTDAEELLVNEISPRVHNAGHHTLESCPTSQFEQHMRAVSGLPLGTVTQLYPAVMRNLLAGPALPKLSEQPSATQPRAGEHIHWYGKREARPFRKMGHLTCLDSDLKTAGLRADRAIISLSGNSRDTAA
jgi:5-(carboxyamino)imidazole ribonucleotide synthase